jgi:hypothetical protein
MKGCLLNYFRAMILVTSLFHTGNSAMVWLPTAGSIIWWNAKSFARPPLTRTESSHFVGHQIHVVSSNSFRLKREIQKILVTSLMKLIQIAIGSLGHWGSPWKSPRVFGPRHPAISPAISRQNQLHSQVFSHLAAAGWEALTAADMEKPILCRGSGGASEKLHLHFHNLATKLFELQNLATKTDVP